MIARRAALLGGAAGLVGGAAPRRARLATVPLSRMDLGWWRLRFAEKQAELRARPPNLVFYGDSITQDWELTGPEAWRNFAPIWERFYGRRGAINLGYKGDTTAHLLWRLQAGEATAIAPRAAVILIGANNFGRLRWPADDTQLGIEKIVTTLRERLPRTRLLLLGVLPSIRNAWVDQQTRVVNAGLARRYGGESEAVFMDLASLFMRGGKVDPDRFIDPKLHPPEPPLHPTAQAQRDMADAIEPTLRRLLA